MQAEGSQMFKVILGVLASLSQSVIYETSSQNKRNQNDNEDEVKEEEVRVEPRELRKGPLWVERNVEEVVWKVKERFQLGTAKSWGRVGGMHVGLAKMN